MKKGVYHFLNAFQNLCADNGGQVFIYVKNDVMKDAFLVPFEYGEHMVKLNVSVDAVTGYYMSDSMLSCSMTFKGRRHRLDIPWRAVALLEYRPLKGASVVMEVESLCQVDEDEELPTAIDPKPAATATGNKRGHLTLVHSK